MSDETIQFVNRWLYNIELILRDRLESLKYDLRSDDENTSGCATKEAGQILDWLLPPLPSLSKAEQLRRVETAFKDKKRSVEDRLAATRRAALSTGRSRGRPRNETSQQAIRALGLHFATPLSWREIALEIRGCNHDRPNPERSCEPCGAAMRDAATRLESFLKTIGSDLTFPRGKELDEKSRLEQVRLWRIEHKLPHTPEDNSFD